MNLLFALILGFTANADDAEFKKIDSAAKKVKIFRKSDPPSNCEEMKEISTPLISVLDDVAYEKMLRRMAVKEGANGLMIIGKSNGSINATIYKCK